MKYSIARFHNGYSKGMWTSKSLQGLYWAFLITLFWWTGISLSVAQVLVGPKPQKVEDQFLLNVPGIKVTSWVENLNVPWSLVFLPDGKAMVSERPGRIRIIEDGILVPEPLACFDDTGALQNSLAACFGVEVGGEGGLMGLALHPEFDQGQPYLYIMHTYEKQGSERTNRVIRLLIKPDGGISIVS